MGQPSFYGPPVGTRRRLSVTPALASWDKAGSVGQARSAAFVDDVHRLIADDLAASPGPLGLALEVGLPVATSLTTRRDLDNYLFPLVPTLTARTGRVFASVRATKRHGGESFVAVGPVQPVEPPAGAYAASIVTTAGAGTPAYKEQIRDQLVGASVLPGSGVCLELAFGVGPRRAWPNLWKATIDSLGRLLGWDGGAGQWNARDGRITDLRLHGTVDPAAGHQVSIWLRASTVDVIQ